MGNLCQTLLVGLRAHGHAQVNDVELEEMETISLIVHHLQTVEASRTMQRYYGRGYSILPREPTQYYDPSDIYERVKSLCYVGQQIVHNLKNAVICKSMLLVHIQTIRCVLDRHSFKKWCCSMWSSSRRWPIELSRGGCCLVLADAECKCAVTLAEP